MVGNKAITKREDQYGKGHQRNSEGPNIQNAIHNRKETTKKRRQEKKNASSAHANFVRMGLRSGGNNQGKYSNGPQAGIVRSESR